MQADRPSDTAAYVAMGRALAHARGAVRGFDEGARIALFRVPGQPAHPFPNPTAVLLHGCGIGQHAQHIGQ